MISAFRLLNGEVAVIRRPKDGEEGIIRTMAPRAVFLVQKRGTNASMVYRCMHLRRLHRAGKRASELR